MIRSICGNEKLRRPCGARNRAWRFEPDAMRPKTDATHRANFRYACGVCLLTLALMLTACSTRVEYDRAFGIDPSPNSININVASAAELEKLPGIGPKTADAIVNFRSENGPFRRVEHLMLIRGVSEARFLELQPYIRAE